MIIESQLQSKALQGLTCLELLERLVLGETGGNNGRSHISAGLGGGGACDMNGTSSAPSKSSSLTYEVGLLLLMRRANVEELKGWQAVG